MTILTRKYYELTLPSYQIKGTKTWSLRPPPECWWSCQGGEMDALMEPGDVIVVNTNWWFHSTSVEDGGLSITVTNEYTEPFNKERDRG